MEVIRYGFMFLSLKNLESKPLSVTDVADLFLGCFFSGGLLMSCNISLCLSLFLGMPYQFLPLCAFFIFVFCNFLHYAQAFCF